jgi:hypothetical protein
MQLRGKHSSKTIEAVFCVVGAEAIWRQLQTEQFSVLSDTDKECVESPGELKAFERLVQCLQEKWIEDLMCVL